MESGAPEPSLYTVKALFILDNDDNRLLAKYYDPKLYPSMKEQRNFEKHVFNKTHKTDSEIAFLEGMTIVYKSSIDLFLYVVGSANENELMLMTVLNCLSESLNLMLRKNVEKRSLVENLDGVFLVVDEIVDGGVILESDPQQVIQKVNFKGDDSPLSEQSVAQQISAKLTIPSVPPLRAQVQASPVCGGASGVSPGNRLHKHMHRCASLPLGMRYRACGKLARNIEALIEKTQTWVSGDDSKPAALDVQDVQTGGQQAVIPAVMPAAAVVNRQWVEQTSPGEGILIESEQEPQRKGLYVLPEDLLDHCNTTATAQKLTNDLLRGLYERECLASHSISGIVYNKKGRPKPALPADEVQAVLRTVQHFFPGKTDAEIKGYIRQKLQNEAKRLRRKPQPPEIKDS
ncbi:COPZ2 protein, partial [Polyodon spathula]|nr:COPZ2 protein [Polyodon spathula]